MKQKILLGPAGNCASDTIKSFEKVKKLGLGAQEIEFVYGITMSNELARSAGKVAKSLKLNLTIHAPYYINLATEEKSKLERSKRWIIDSCERAHYLGAKSVVFHPGFYMGRDPDEVFNLIFDALKDIKSQVKKYDVDLAPETTGKLSAFGSLEELTKLARKLHCKICIDFAHLYARNQGKIDYDYVLKQASKVSSHIQSHFSGIQFSERGERKHLNIDSSQPPFKDLAREILKKKLDITIICESPAQYLDSLKMKKVFESLGYKF